MAQSTESIYLDRPVSVASRLQQRYATTSITTHWLRLIMTCQLMICRSRQTTVADRPQTVWQLSADDLTADASADDYLEVIFRYNRKRCCTHSPSPLHGIARVTSLKVLGVTLTDRLSVTAHVDDVVGSCARSMYAISVLRSHDI